MAGKTISRLTPEGAVVIALAGLSFFCVSDTIRESDQASLLDGALTLARGEASPWSADFYNYDRQFLTYWIIGVVLRVALAVIGEAHFGTHHLLYVTNLAAAGIFWTGVIVLVLARARGDRFTAVLLLAILLAPSVLLNAPILSSNFISAGFLALVAVILGGNGTPAAAVALLVAVLSFAAVGARADAVLCLPFLCWVTVNPSRWKPLVSHPLHWASFVGAAGALIAGEILMTGDSILFYTGRIVWRIVGAYLVFGLGAALLVLALVYLLLASRVARAETFRRKSFFIAGALFVTLPLLFYGHQLATPRHLVTTAWILLFFVTASRGRALIRLGLTVRARRLVGASVGVAALTPLIVGIHLPALSTPAVVVTNSTLYPTADGLWPMGAYLDFLGRLRRAADEPIDHNQALWNSLTESELPSLGIDVPLYWTPMLSYVKLAATLQRKRGVVYREAQYRTVPFLIGDERALRKFSRPLSPGEKSSENLALLATRPKWVISKAEAKQPILRIDASGVESRPSDAEVEKRLALTQCFRGNEFDVMRLGGDSWRWRPEARGKLVVFFSDRPFEAVLHRVDGTRRSLGVETLDYLVPNGGRGRLFVAPVHHRETLVAERVSVDEGASEVGVAQAVLPGYMSVESID